MSPEERKKEREKERKRKNAIYSGHLCLCQQPRAAHALHSDQKDGDIPRHAVVEAELRPGLNFFQKKLWHHHNVYILHTSWLHLLRNTETPPTSLLNTFFTPYTHPIHTSYTHLYTLTQLQHTSYIPPKGNILNYSRIFHPGKVSHSRQFT